MSGRALSPDLADAALLSVGRPRSRRRASSGAVPTCPPRPRPGKMLPELARTVIRAYSQPGEPVLDPMCGIGTTIVEAIPRGART